MKVAQNDETNPDTQSVRPPHLPNLSNSQLPLRSICPKTQNIGNTFPDVPPFAGTTYCRVRTHLAPLIVMPYIVMLMFALYLLFLPPLLSGRPRDRCWCPCERLRRRRPFFPFSGASRQAPPLIIPISPIPFSHACIRFCYCNWLLLFGCIACLCNLLILNCLV